eukprot:scaffold19962_cov19-Tisochrysis_lutea.AAC.2
MDASMPLPASASPDHIRGGGMSRRRYNDSPPPLRSAGGYLDRHAPHPSRRAPVPMDEYDRMPLSTRGLPPPRGSSRYDPPLRHTGFSGPPPPLMDMRGRGLSRSPTPPPYGACISQVEVSNGMCAFLLRLAGSYCIRKSAAVCLEGLSRSVRLEQ